ncbi:MAG: BrnT family toxin [Coriobacteriia bacterium]|nr:BrnT family toxin [Coriobacteriia bacterium]
METLQFIWDPQKNTINFRKHGVTFEEASTVFEDRWARVIDDPDHSIDEQRFIILGMSKKPRLLIVCHCYRDQKEIIRIFSARKATKTESTFYEEHRRGEYYA